MINRISRLDSSAELARDTRAGFTFLEVLLSITLFILLAGFSMGVSRGLQIRNDLDVATNTVAQSLRRAQLLSQAIEGDSSWGLFIGTGQIVLFQGDSYAGRDIDYDESFTIPDVISVSGLNEVVYTKFYGLPDSTGTITLTSINNERQNITINSQGMLSY